MQPLEKADFIQIFQKIEFFQGLLHKKSPRCLMLQKVAEKCPAHFLSSTAIFQLEAQSREEDVHTGSLNCSG